MRFPLSYDATTTREDFVRLLADATGDSSFRESEGRFFGKDWAIRLTPIAPLEIGLIRLERHRVEIELDGMTPEDQQSFLARFTLHYQRGGG